MGSVRQFLAKDHARLDDLLQQAISQSDRFNHDAYREFRRGLLRHIAMEEKVLLPTIHRLRGGAPLLSAAKLRLDHGALGALVMPTPTQPIIDLIRTILHSHNLLEEGPGGVYEQCEEVPGVEKEKLLNRLQAVPAVSVAAYNDSPTVFATIGRIVTRAGYSSHSLELLGNHQNDA